MEECFHMKQLACLFLDHTAEVTITLNVCSKNDTGKNEFTRGSKSIFQ